MQKMAQACIKNQNQSHQKNLYLLSLVAEGAAAAAGSGA